jgi:hypothetical protein
MRHVNAFTRWILHPPFLRRLADGQVCELRFAGRRSGRPVVLPVMYAQQFDEIVVLVGGPERKRWWRRNFTWACRWCPPRRPVGRRTGRA